MKAVSNETNEKIIMLYLLDKYTSQEIATKTGSSGSYVGRLTKVLDLIRAQNYAGLETMIANGYSSVNRATVWCFNFLGEPIPENIVKAIYGEKKRPRKVKVTDDECKKIIEMATQGKTDQEIESAIGVSSVTARRYRTAYLWMRKGEWQRLETLVLSNASKAVAQVSRCAGIQIPTTIKANYSLDDCDVASDLEHEADTDLEDIGLANTDLAITKLLEAINTATVAITTAADDICQTMTSLKKLNEDCINSNFDVLTAQVRDGIESVKTTIRKSKS